MRWVVVVLMLGAGPAFGQMLAGANCKAALRVPPGWEIALNGSGSATDLVPVNAGQQRQRIHLVLSKYQGGTIEDAINREIDSVTARSGGRGSSNDRSNLSAIKPVQTTAGLPGFVAEFGGQGPAGWYFWINKFYFRNADGKIFCVCAHVYGDRQAANDFQGTILDNLLLAP